MRTYSVSEAAEQLLGGSMKHPELWLRRRIREGTIHASRLGREIRMTQQQIYDAFAAFDVSGRQLKAVETTRLGVTAASLRRRSA